MSFYFGPRFDSNDYGFNITSREVYNAPDYDINSVEVPGRSGNVLIPQGRFKNKIVTYHGFMRGDSFTGSTKWEKLSTGLSAFKSALLKEPGYQRLIDTYDPGMVRWAYVNGEINAREVLDRPEGAEISVSFMCKPFLEKEAPEIQTTGADVTVTNPYLFDGIMDIYLSRPASSHTTMTITDQQTMASRTWTFDPDCSSYINFKADELEWVSTGGVLQNQYVTPSDLSSPFPTIPASWFAGAVSKISFSNITQASISIRWRTL